MPTAAVRELAEETGLTASETDAHIVTMVHDDRLDVRRVSAVVRVTAWDGALALPEPHRFARWEWHDPHTLATLGPIFAPSAQALNEVWPGVLPGLPTVHSYPCASTDTVVKGGWAPSAAVRSALHTVPRHRFAPEVPLETVYDDDLAVVTARDRAGCDGSATRPPHPRILGYSTRRSRNPSAFSSSTSGDSVPTS